MLVINVLGTLYIILIDPVFFVKGPNISVNINLSQLCLFFFQLTPSVIRH